LNKPLATYENKWFLKHVTKKVCMVNFILTEDLNVLDPDVKRIIDLEAERQNRKLILIPSESSAPNAVRESLGSVLQNIYAEGYPHEFTRKFLEDEILDLESQILHFRRNSNPRYYKGVEFVDILEELARRRCAELFANKKISADDIFVNVQALSGAPANNAVYQALLEPGDTILGMSLFHGGHLTHGSSVNRSGKLYNAFHYSVDPKTEKLNYDQIRSIAKEKNPKIIIAGFSSYPWVPDWKTFREIANEIGAFLFADISHIAGLIAGKTIPSPVGFADVVTFTTHKTLCGPRGACILSFNENISKKIDRAVFPGEQGGPHVQVFAGMATSFKLANSKQFSDFQKQVAKNCLTLSGQLNDRGIRIAYGGTNTHLANIDCKSIKSVDGVVLSGDMAARILDIVGIVTNSNTIPGDKSTLHATGIRLGTPWITQRGLSEDDMIELGNIIADLLFSIKPYAHSSDPKSRNRAKVDFDALKNAKSRVRILTKKAIPSVDIQENEYPFFYFSDDLNLDGESDWVSFKLTGERIRQSLNFIIPIDIEGLELGLPQKTSLCVSNSMIDCVIEKISQQEFSLAIKKKDAGDVSEWLRGLSDGFLVFDSDLEKKIPGPFSVFPELDRSFEKQNNNLNQSPKGLEKPYFIGIDGVKDTSVKPLPEFTWEEKETRLKRTPLYEWHKTNGAKLIPFAGWEMPVWYTSVLEEHSATRNNAGLFDITHMGVFHAEGLDAVAFLDSVCGNSIGALKVDESCYTHFLDPNGNVIDDLLIYRHDKVKYLIVVNAANEEKDWAWLTAVKNGFVKIDNKFSFAKAYGRDCVLKNLKDPANKEEMRVAVALQGPKSRDILEWLGLTKSDIKNIRKLGRTELCHATFRDKDLIVSRTGYTGEMMAFELFIHPDSALMLWKALMKTGEPFGISPCGLGSRDSLRTEAGLPLYGHELSGSLNISVGEAGFGSYIKTHKPWFIGRDVFLEQEKKREKEVIRFRFDEKNVRVAHYGDLVLNARGKAIGNVTSCVIDSEGFLTGQALILQNAGETGAEIFIYQSSQKMDDMNLRELDIGCKIQLPSKAKVQRRFEKFG
jgi:glycine hydroxymethyltransferase